MNFEVILEPQARSPVPDRGFNAVERYLMPIECGLSSKAFLRVFESTRDPWVAFKEISGWASIVLSRIS